MESELAWLFKVMKKEFPGITDPQLMVKCEWMLEKYGRITCEQKQGADVNPRQIARVPFNSISNCS